MAFEGTHIVAMLTIRNLDSTLKEKLRLQAAEHSHSMEAEARSILQSALTRPEQPAGSNLLERIQGRFLPLGGVDLDQPQRELAQQPPRFD
jgi:plasmid stability protein